MSQPRVMDDRFISEVEPFYLNDACHSRQEFVADVKRLSSIRKALTKYERTGLITLQSFIVHIKVLYNVFGATQAPKIFKKFFSKEHLRYLKCFLRHHETGKVTYAGADRELTDRFKDYLNVSR